MAEMVGETFVKVGGQEFRIRSAVRENWSCVRVDEKRLPIGWIYTSADRDRALIGAAMEAGHAMAAAGPFEWIPGDQ